MADGSETGSPVKLDCKPSNETIVELSGQGGTESTGNNAAATSAERDDELKISDELMVKGDEAAAGKDYSEATDCYSRALEIRATLFGELDPRCVNAYYKYGCALLRKAQEEADPLVSVPKRKGDSLQNSCKDEPAKRVVSAESSATSVESSNGEGEASVHNEKEINNDSKLKDIEENEEEDESEDEDTSEGDEDESDLDLAWKMLDIARAIVEKCSEDTMEKVDILTALAEVALEREDMETSCSDYLKALSILERLVEPDSRRICELNFMICLCLETGSKPQEAISYCEKAISVCKSRLERLAEEVKTSLVPTESSSDLSVTESSSIPHSTDNTDKEIETLTDLCSELEKKREELKHAVVNPTPVLQDILAMYSAKAKGSDKISTSVAMDASQVATVNSGGGLDSPTVSTAHTNGSSKVTDLGVVGRGVKRVHLDSIASETKPEKKPSLDPPN
ncbi:unnamed protein product [Cuscuta campestris]|uniref:Tetratricopeptide SHNi-TPR domain-containing protein n=1 Tax=Cuscuta campestris TaxID=132261 RepID=A0A484MUC5_9ASTE|nr:unnamed protein product [Cuscuta campestris]